MEDKQTPVFRDRRQRLSLLVKLQKGDGMSPPALIKITSFRFYHFRRCLRRPALRPRARDSSGDPRVLLELEEERPIGQGKLSKMPTGRYLFTQ